MNAETRATPPGAMAPAPALPDGHRIGGLEIQSVWHRGTDAVVYRAWDHALVRPVAIKEYLPSGWARRDVAGTRHTLRPAGPATAALFEHGLRGFVDEARALARCDHPSLVRVLDLIETGGTAYRVMPWYDGLTLLDLRRKMGGPFGEPALRKLLDQLLGALAAWQRVGGVHRGVDPAQVLLLDEYKALLLGPGTASRSPGSTVAGAAAAPAAAQGAEADQGEQGAYAPPEQTRPSGQPQGPWTDFYSLAAVARFCITGLPPPPAGTEAPEPLAATVERLFPRQPAVRYSAELMRALDAALATDVTRRPQTADQWREMLGGATSEEADLAPVHSLRTVDAGTQALIRRVIDSIDEPGPELVQAPPQTPSRRASPGAARETAQAKVPTEAPPREPTLVPSIDHFHDSTEPTPLAARSEPLPLHADPTDRHGPDALPQPPTPGRYRPVWISAAMAAVVAAALVAWGLKGEPVRPAETASPAVVAPQAPPSQPLVTPTSATPAGATPAGATPANATGRTATGTVAPPVSATPSPPTAPAAPGRLTPASPTPPGATRPVGLTPPTATTPTAPPTRAAAPPARSGAVEPIAAATPRQACGTRTEFALYRCMQQQCGLARWKSHPQCVRLAETDSVD